MKKISPSLKFFLTMARTQAVMARRFDGRIPHGLGLNDFMILYQLSQNPEGKMRRVDLAEKIGLTASGVTRMLLPMEKIGLVKREVNEQDGRVSYVALANGGKILFEEALQWTELLAEELLPAKTKNIEELSSLLETLGKTL